MEGRAHNPFGENVEAASLLHDGVGRRTGLARGGSARSFAIEGAQNDAPSPLAEVEEEEEDALDEGDDSIGRDSGSGLATDATGMFSPSSSGHSGAGGGSGSNGFRRESGNRTLALRVPSSGNIRVPRSEMQVPHTATASQGRSFLVDANPTFARQGQGQMAGK